MHGAVFEGEGWSKGVVNELGPEAGKLQKDVEVWLGKHGSPRLPEVASSSP